ncbi:MAG: YesL family protein [Trueperella sp.]|nr:YesL family protein [Trueperella sp.]
MFSPDSAGYRALAAAADLVIINLLTILAALPIFTAGAAFTACTRVTMEIAREEDSYIMRSWWKSFRTNFVQSLAWWLPLLALLVLGAIELRILGSSNSATASGAVSGLVIAGILVILAITTWLVPLIAFFDNRITKHLANAGRLALGKIGYTAASLVVLLLPAIIFVLLPATRTPVIWFMLLIGFAFISYLQALIMRRPINKLRDAAR